MSKPGSFEQKGEIRMAPVVITVVAVAVFAAVIAAGIIKKKWIDDPCQKRDTVNQNRKP